MTAPSSQGCFPSPLQAMEGKCSQRVAPGIKTRCARGQELLRWGGRSRAPGSCARRQESVRRMLLLAAGAVVPCGRSPRRAVRDTPAGHRKRCAGRLEAAGDVVVGGRATSGRSPSAGRQLTVRWEWTAEDEASLGCERGVGEAFMMLLAIRHFVAAEVRERYVQGWCRGAPGCDGAWCRRGGVGRGKVRPVIHTSEDGVESGSSRNKCVEGVSVTPSEVVDRAGRLEVGAFHMHGLRHRAGRYTGVVHWVLCMRRTCTPSQQWSLFSFWAPPAIAYLSAAKIVHISLASVDGGCGHQVESW